MPYRTKTASSANSANRAPRLPSSFDPLRFPILARHYFGEPANDHAACLTCQTTAQVVDLNLIRLAVALHRLGVSLGADVGTRRDVLARLEQHAGRQRLIRFQGQR